MKRFNIILNLILFSAGLFLVGTAILLAWRLPHGSSGQFMTFLGQDRHAWGALHMWLGLVMVAGVTTHLAAHWRWIWRVASNQKRGPLLSVGIVALLVLGFFAFVPVEPAANEGGRGHRLAQTEDTEQAGVGELRTDRVLEWNHSNREGSALMVFPRRGLRDGSGGGERLNQSDRSALDETPSVESARRGEGWAECPQRLGAYGGKGLGRTQQVIEESNGTAAPQT